MDWKNLFALNGETIHLDDEVRSSAPGGFIELSDGMTHYQIAGPENGHPVVFVNGYSIPNYLWNKNFLTLANSGFRVIRFDLYGRGFSDRPKIDYSPSTFDRQLLELLTALQVNAPVHLIGSSMGGVVAAIFCDRHPERVDRMILVDPAGMMDAPSFPYSSLNIPLVGEIVMHLFGNIFIVPGMEKDLLHPEKFPEYITNYLPQMEIIGFKRAILSTFRSGMLSNQGDVYRRLGHQERAILLLWGEADQTIPIEIGQKVRAVLPKADYRVIEQAGHVPHYERPEVVNPIMIDFLKKSHQPDR